jgi:hypothetical protein
MLSITINTEHIFNQVNMRSLYISDQVDPALGELMIDKIPLTEDERDFFKIALRDASARIASMLSYMYTGIANPFVLDEENGLLIYNINEEAHSHPQIIESILPALIMRACVVWIIKEWLRTKGIANSYYLTELAEYDEVISEIKKLTKQKTSRLQYRTY